MEILEQQLGWLELEREEDLRQYHENVLKRSLKQRVEKGVTWYPVHMERTSIGLGDRVIVEVERTSQKDRSSFLQAGSVVSVFGMSADKEVGKAVGTVYTIRRGKMKIVLGTGDIPYWLHHAKVGVNLDFDDRTYREMKAAIKVVIKAKNNRLAELRNVMLGNATPEFGEWDYKYDHPDLNRSQVRAVQNALEAKDIAIIHGPPGTGKTTTLVQAILETVKREQQVLACAPSNTAADLLTLKCVEQGLSVLRVGNPARVEEELHHHTLDQTVSRHPDYPAMRKMRKQVEALYREANKFKRNFGKEEYQKRRDLQKEARAYKDYAETLEKYILSQVIQNAQVITSTLTGAAHSTITRNTYHTIFIDEAAQALTPACWIPIARAKKVVFAGDHHQLPPTVKSMEAAKAGLAKTLFETLIETKKVDVMLEEQYRMNEKIMGFSSRQFYKGKLIANPAVKHHTLGLEIAPVEFVDTAGCGFEEKKNADLSTYNTEEADLVLKHLALLLNQLQEMDPGIFDRPFSVGVIAPYKGQVKVLQKQFDKSPMLSTYEPFVTINTVDGFQGQERDVMYISLTRSNPKGEIGFLKDVRRMNVALTRARKKLVVVGDSATIGKNGFFKAFLDYIDEIDAYRSAWELST